MVEAAEELAELGGSLSRLEPRLAAPDREWDTGRGLEALCGALGLVGIYMAAAGCRREGLGIAALTRG